jgi:hypothetical protein
MGDLINLSLGEPSARAAPLRVHSALASTEVEIERVLIGQKDLDGEMSKGAEARQDSTHLNKLPFSTVPTIVAAKTRAGLSSDPSLGSDYDATRRLKGPRTRFALLINEPRVV